MQDLVSFLQSQKVESETLVVVLDPMAEVIGQVSLSGKVHCLFELLFILYQFCVVFVYLNCKVGEKLYIDARANYHDEDVDEPFEVGLRNDVSVS